MVTLLLLGGLVVLFVLLGLSANLTVSNTRILGERLHISPFALGLMLGMLTTLPELFVGINATLKEVSAIAFGNLTGGVLVVLGLITGLSIFLNKAIQTTPIFYSNWIILMGTMMVAPMFLAVDGTVSLLDGLVLVVLYILIINGLLTNPRIREENRSRIEEIKHNLTTKKAIVLALGGAVGIVVFAHFTVELALVLARALSLPLLFTGLVIFSVGTNLPELTVTLTSWQRGAKKLGLGNLIGSAFTNPLIIGILAALKPISVRVTASFWIIFILLLLVVYFYIHFGLTGHKFTRREGAVLLLIYFAFLLSELIWLLA